MSVCRDCASFSKCDLWVRDIDPACISFVDNKKSSTLCFTCLLAKEEGDHFICRSSGNKKSIIPGVVNTCGYYCHKPNVVKDSRVMPPAMFGFPLREVFCPNCGAKHLDVKDVEVLEKRVVVIWACRDCKQVVQYSFWGEE